MIQKSYSKTLILHSLELTSGKWNSTFQNAAICTYHRPLGIRWGHNTHYVAITPVTPCSQCKYLGVIIQSDLKWNHNVEEKVTEANQMLAMIWRNVFVASKITRELAYNTSVRPHLEYASVIWSPWQSYLEDALEKFRVEQYDMFVLNTVYCS